MLFFIFLNLSFLFKNNSIGIHNTLPTNKLKSPSIVESVIVHKDLDPLLEEELGKDVHDVNKSDDPIQTVDMLNQILNYYRNKNKLDYLKKIQAKLNFTFENNENTMKLLKNFEMDDKIYKLNITNGGLYNDWMYHIDILF